MRGFGITAEGTVTTQRVTRDDLADSITDTLLVVQDHDVSELNQSDIEILVTLLRCSLVFLANDDFDFIDIEAT